ncbi:hypothetical protein BTVI_38237 [Pitangus sulphuratus]|nr:hypothetical protein BTVI_38237 [Pitangus sulphuratus]
MYKMLLIPELSGKLSHAKEPEKGENEMCTGGFDYGKQETSAVSPGDVIHGLSEMDLSEQEERVLLCGLPKAGHIPSSRSSPYGKNSILSVKDTVIHDKLQSNQEIIAGFPLPGFAIEDSYFYLGQDG